MTAGGAAYLDELVQAAEAPTAGGLPPELGGRGDLAPEPEWLGDGIEAITAGDTNAGRTPGPVRERARLRTVSIEELLTQEWPEPPWVVRGLLPVGLTLLAGRPKVGKSWLGLQLAQAVATGGMFLGAQVDVGSVLYLALEDPPRRLAERARLQGWVALRASCDFVTVGGLRDIGFLNKGGSRELVALVAANGYRLLIIDTLSRAISGDLNDAREMTQALAPLQAMAHEYGCAVVLVDHFNKLGAASPFRGASLEVDPESIDPVVNILGSTAKAAMADCLWGLYRQAGKAGAVLAVTGRDVEEARLVLAQDGATHCWQVEGPADGLKITKSRRELLDVLGDLDGATCKELADALGWDKGNTFRRLQDLRGAGLLEREGDRYHLVSQEG